LKRKKRSLEYFLKKKPNEADSVYFYGDYSMTPISTFIKRLRKFNITRIQQAKYGLAVSIAILCIILYIVYSVNRRNNELAQDVAYSASVIATLEKINATISARESAQRGYVITSFSGFTESFAESEENLDAQLKMLKDLVGSSGVQWHNMNELVVLLDEQHKWLTDNMTNQNLSRLLMGKMLMTRVLNKIQIMRDVEDVQMGRKIYKLREWSNSSAIVIIISVVSSAIMIVIAYLILINEYVFKLKAEQQLLISQSLLKEKIEMLDVSNKELEQFAYIASHDLQEPLRKILTFSERIHEKFAAISNPDLEEYLDRISAAASRMRVLIDDLLTYSKTSRSDIHKEPVRLDPVFNIIKDNCEVIIQNRNVTFWQPQPLPEIMGDKTQMVQLFQNLISNAIKFTEADVSPRIEILCSMVKNNELIKEVTAPLYQEYYKIVIKDNGIGFEEKNAKQIFTIFQRLHGRSEYEGTGIGLSICKKIVENHQGYVRAQSQPGKGSSFMIYLPRTGTN
jgi:signal transduction histidine kinase